MSCSARTTTPSCSRTTITDAPRRLLRIADRPPRAAGSVLAHRSRRCASDRLHSRADRSPARRRRCSRDAARPASWRLHGVRNPAQFCAIGACAARKTRPAEDWIQARRRRAMTQCGRDVTVLARRAVSATRAHACRKNCLKQAVCVVHARACTARRNAQGRRRRPRAPARGRRMRVGCGKNICAKVLTVEKTVIRFRPING